MEDSHAKLKRMAVALARRVIRGLMDDYGVVVGEADRDTATERVPHHHDRLVDLERVEQGDDPCRVAADRELVGREVGRPTEPGHRRRDHPATLRGDGLDDIAVGVLGERPAVQEDDGHALPHHAVTGRSSLDPRALVDRYLARAAGFSQRNTGLRRLRARCVRSR